MGVDDDHVAGHFQARLLAAECHDVGHASRCGFFNQQIDNGQVFARRLQQELMRIAAVNAAIAGIPATLAQSVQRSSWNASPAYQGATP